MTLAHGFVGSTAIEAGENDHDRSTSGGRTALQPEFGQVGCFHTVHQLQQRDLERFAQQR
jgi:hypothetical protein